MTVHINQYFAVMDETHGGEEWIMSQWCAQWCNANGISQET